MPCEPTQLPDPEHVDVSALREKYREERNRRAQQPGFAHAAIRLDLEAAGDSGHRRVLERIEMTWSD